jgi:hypothetical protein
MFGLALAGYHYGNLKNMKMNDDIEKMRINKSRGYVYLLDFDMSQVAAKKFNSIKMRKDIIEFWRKTYRLDEKSYYLIISPM